MGYKIAVLKAFFRSVLQQSDHMLYCSESVQKSRNNVTGGHCVQLITKSK